jgi:oligogalacturonide lyase
MQTKKYMRINEMPKGRKLENKFTTYTDSYSGRLITKLTPDHYLSHHPYFQNKALTSDNRFLIYSNDSDGFRNLYKMNLDDGSSLQLTEEKRDIFGFSATLSKDDRHLFYSGNNDVRRICLDTLEDQIIYETPEEWVAWGQTFSSDEQFLVISEIKRSDLVMAGSWDAFEPQWALKPQCRIVCANIQTGERFVVHSEKNCWISHSQIRPYDNSTVLFCHEGPSEKIDARLWLVNIDGTNHRCARPKKSQDEWISHEYWLSDGSRFAYLFRNRREEPISSIMLMDPETLTEEKIMDCQCYCHMISNADNGLIVGDSNQESTPYIYLAHLQEKREEILCCSNSSWKSYGTTQDSHPHPLFSPDGKIIIFTSDMDGLPGVYRVVL